MYKVAKGVSFLRLENNSGKVWLVPLNNLKLALGIYQPSSLKGRLLKVLLPFVKRSLFLCRVISAQRVGVEMGEDLRKLICRVLNVNGYNFSIFEGTPSVHKKPTIQIFDDSNILAYCKLSCSEDVITLFDAERGTLAELQAVGLKGIPSILYCGKVARNSRCVALVSSTQKTINSQSCHLWGESHWRFLSEMCGRTKRTMTFEKSDVAASLSTLEKSLPKLPQEAAKVCRVAIDGVRERYAGREVEFSAYHGDFTPWNMTLEQGELFVFDWEYSSLSYPMYLDWFHFFTQTALLGRGLSAEAIVREFKLHTRELTQYFDKPKLLYSIYLLSIVSRYIDRERDGMSLETKGVVASNIMILNNIW